jgi:hypothetical protein
LGTLETGDGQPTRLTVCVSVFSRAADGLEQQGPLFLLEPVSRVEFSNSSGAHVDCSAHGSPPLRVEWLLADGSPALPVPQLRVLHPNGTLELPPFPAERLRHDVHSALYRCRVSNQLGATISRDVHVRAGTLIHYSPNALSQAAGTTRVPSALPTPSNGRGSSFRRSLIMFLIVETNAEHAPLHIKFQ